MRVSLYVRPLQTTGHLAQRLLIRPPDDCFHIRRVGIMRPFGGKGQHRALGSDGTSGTRYTDCSMISPGLELNTGLKPGQGQVIGDAATIGGSIWA